MSGLSIMSREEEEAKRGKSTEKTHVSDNALPPSTTKRRAIILFIHPPFSLDHINKNNVSQVQTLLYTQLKTLLPRLPP